VQTGDLTSADITPLRAAPLGELAAPVLFVVFWSTGFLVVRAAAPHADLSLFLAARFAIAGLVLGRLAKASGGRAGHMVTRRRCTFLPVASCTASISWPAMPLSAGGLSAGVMALIGALQPIITVGFATCAASLRRGGFVWGSPAALAASR
jgi:drug/metabolite transporter (DMT)-like permease